MKCKRKMQKRRDVLTVIGMMILLAFILRMWPILLLMLIGVFFYALWMLFHICLLYTSPSPRDRG